jgi:hypothetical protein
VPAPDLTCPEDSSATGAFTLGWSGPEGATYRLEESGGGVEGALYEGADLGTTITGRRPGRYDYRVGVVEGGDVEAWSEGCSVEVAPPSLGLALALFAAGGLTTLLTVVAVLTGHRAHRRGQLG